MAVAVCRCTDVCVLLLISVISTDTKRGCDRFYVTGWSAGTSAYWLWLNYSFGAQSWCLAMWSMSMTVWRLAGVEVGSSTGNGAMTAKWKWSMRSSTSFLHQQKRWSSFFTSTADPPPPPSSSSIHLPSFSSTTICLNKTLATRSDIRWWIDPRCQRNILVRHDEACFSGIDRLGPLKPRQFMPATRQQHISKRSSPCGKKILTRWNCHRLRD